jgi:hypothetical protein
MGNKPIGKSRRWLSGMPLVGPLFACRKEDYISATREFIIIIAFSTATFWLSALVLVMLDSRNELTYAELFSLTIRDGQLFIFATALLGPILIFATEDPPNARPFPARTWIILTLVLLAIVCSGSYALMRGINLRGTNVSLNQTFLANAAIACGLIAATFRYVAIVYNKYRMRPEEVKASEENFINQFKQRHRAEASHGGEEQQ